MEIQGLKILTGIQPDHYRSLLMSFENRYEGDTYDILTGIAKRVLEDTLDKRFIFLCGTPGCGKTHFLVGLFRARVLKDSGVMGGEYSLYIQFPALITEIIDSFSDTPSTRVSLIKYFAIKYLFIDDISKGERVLDSEKIEGQVFREILLDRYESNKFLVATSNYTATEMKRMVRSVHGDYVLSRLESSSIFVEFPKGDFRRSEIKV